MTNEEIRDQEIDKLFEELIAETAKKTDGEVALFLVNSFMSQVETYGPNRFLLQIAATITKLLREIIKLRAQQQLTVTE